MNLVNNANLRLCLVATLAGLLCLCVLSWPAVAQDVGGIRGLDDERFIQGLRERGLTELAEYFLENFKTDDPLLRLSLLAETQKLRADDENFTDEERAKAYLDVLETYRQLLAQAEKVPEAAWKLPKWRTDFAEYALSEVLPFRYRQADAFAEFGVPTLEQERVFKQLASETAVAMDKAHMEMFNLLGELPKRDDFEREFENTGLWDMLIHDYHDLKLPFFRAQAWHYASLLPEPPKVINLAEAGEGLKRLLAEGKLSGAGVAKALSLLGRIQIKLGKLGEAAKNLQQAAETEDAEPFDVFIAQMALASVKVAEKQDPAALAALDELSRSKTAVESPLLLILVFDARYRITTDTGEYQKLFVHAAVKDIRGAIEGYVNNRIVERADVGAGVPDIEDKSTLEVMALVDAQVKQAGAAQEPAEKDKKLEIASGLIKALLERGGLEPSVESRIRFQAGMVEYQRKAMAEAVGVWLALVEKLPDQAEASGAAVNAFKIASALYKQNKASALAEQLMEKATTTLLEKFPDADVGGGQPARVHWYTLGSFYRERERWDEAVAAYSNVTQDHPYHANALYEKLDCQFRPWAAGATAGADGQAPNRDTQLAAGEGLVVAADAALKAIAAAPADKKQAMQQAEADATLIKAQALSAVAMLPPPNASPGDQARHAQPFIDEAMGLLEGYEKRYEALPDLVANMRQQRVNLLILQGKVPQATAEVDKIIAESPDQSGPLIQGVLDLLNRQVAELQSTLPGSPHIAEFREVGVNLALMLRDWAAKQDDFKNNPVKMLSIQDIYGRQLIAAGKCAEAVALYEELKSQKLGAKPDGTPITGAGQINVLLGLARGYQCSKNAQDADKAIELLNEIITKAPSKNEFYWGAWVTLMQILDARYDAAEDQRAVQNDRVRNIFLPIGQLQATVDRRLGGPPHGPELLRLRNKNQPK